jgi:hypothetical protein
MKTDPSSQSCAAEFSSGEHETDRANEAIAAGIPLLPLLIRLSVTRTVFTFIGLAFGSRLGERYERGAECLAGIILVILAALFTAERLI